jgi:hypothetical protein
MPAFSIANHFHLLPTPGMDIKHLTSDTLRSLLSITSKKEQLIKAVADIENEIAKALKGAVASVVETAETVTPSKPAKKRKKRSKKAKATTIAKKPAKSKKRKSGLTPEGRARLAANMKDRWAAKKAGKPVAKVGRSAKKKSKASKNPF